MLEIKLEHYVEFFYPYNPDRGYSYTTYERKIEERDPLKFLDNDCAYGFRFFDVKVAIVPEEVSNELGFPSGYKLMGKRSNYSNMFYYNEQYKPNAEPGDITIDEYRSKIKKMNI